MGMGLSDLLPRTGFHELRAQARRAAGQPEERRSDKIKDFLFYAAAWPWTLANVASNGWDGIKGKVKERYEERNGEKLTLKNLKKRGGGLFSNFLSPDPNFHEKYNQKTESFLRSCAAIGEQNRRNRERIGKENALLQKEIGLLNSYLSCGIGSRAYLRASARGSIKENEWDERALELNRRYFPATHREMEVNLANHDVFCGLEELREELDSVRERARDGILLEQMPFNLNYSAMETDRTVVPSSLVEELETLPDGYAVVSYEADGERNVLDGAWASSSAADLFTDGSNLAAARGADWMPVLVVRDAEANLPAHLAPVVGGLPPDERFMVYDPDEREVVSCMIYGGNMVGKRTCVSYGDSEDYTALI